MPDNSADYGDLVYQGGAIAPIRDVAEKLGANVQWDPSNATVKVNGQYTPYTSLQNGKSYGSIYDVAAVAGGKVVDMGNGQYAVYKPRQTAGQAPPAQAPQPGSTAVTGNPTTTAAAPAAQPSQPQGTPVTGNPTAPTPSIGAIPGFLQMTPEQQNAALISQMIKTGVITPEQLTANAKAQGVDLARQFGSNPVQAVYTSPPPQPQQTQREQQAQGGPPGYTSPGAFSYTDQPIDYNALNQRAQMMALDWVQPQIERLNFLAQQAQQRYNDQVGYINSDLQQKLADLRAGEVQREQRINEDMNRRGEAIYNSGVRFAALSQQQQAAVAKEAGLTQQAAAKLGKLADSLNLNLANIANQMKVLAERQGTKAMLTLQQLADKAQSQAFENKKLAWQMYMQGAKLSLDQQDKANTLWLNIQRIRSEDERAAAERELKWAIANNQLDAEWAKIMGYDANGNPTLAAQQQQWKQIMDQANLTGYMVRPDGTIVRTLDGQKVDLAQAKFISDQTGYVVDSTGRFVTDDKGNPVRNLAGAQFDEKKREFDVSEANKAAYQAGLLDLRMKQLISDQQYKDAQLKLQQGRLDLDTAKLLQDQQTQANTASNSAWKSLMSELSALDDPVKMSGMKPEDVQAIVKAAVGKWAPQLSASDQATLKAYLKSRGWMQ